MGEHVWVFENFGRIGDFHMKIAFLKNGENPPCRSLKNPPGFSHPSKNMPYEKFPR